MKKKKIDLEEIPVLLEKVTALIDRELNVLGGKAALSSEEAKTLIAYAGALSTIYKDYRAECLSIEKDLKTKSKEEILTLVKNEVRNG